jgi:hypothetical protein
VVCVACAQSGHEEVRSKLSARRHGLDDETRALIVQEEVRRYRQRLQRKAEGTWGGAVDTGALKHSPIDIRSARRRSASLSNPSHSEATSTSTSTPADAVAGPEAEPVRVRRAVCIVAVGACRRVCV